MCRLYAQHAPAPLPIDEPLLAAKNALCAQSRKHPHGWGVAWWDAAGALHVRRGVKPAHADCDFAAAARVIRAQVALAHVRDASVGKVSAENTHPFVHAGWVLAHNGTIAGFDRLRAGLEAEIDAPLRAALRGDTDSERCLFLFLTRLAARERPGAPAGLEEVRAALADTVEVISALSGAPGEKPTSLNLVVTDGRILAACRSGRTLHLRRAAGLVALSSEPVGAGPWREIPEGGFVGADEVGRVVEAALQAPRSAAA